MKQTKRVLSVVLCLVMVLCAVPVMEAKAESTHILDIDWDLIGEVGYQTSSGPCAAYALAYCRTLIDGYSHSYNEYYINGACHWSNGNYRTTSENEDTAQEMLKGMYDRLNCNSPVVAHLYSSSNTQHWVAVVGYQNVSDPNNLSMDNFLMIDPGTSRFKNLFPLSYSYRGYTLHSDHRYAYSLTNEQASGPSAPSYIDLGDDFYANILLNAGWATVGVVNDNVEIVPAEGKMSEYWHFIRNEDDSYTIYNCSNNKVLDVVGAGTDDGTNVWVYENCGSDNQKWYITGRWSGEYVLHPKNSNKVLDAANNDNAVGTNLQIWSNNDSNAQKFAIYVDPKPSYVDIGDDFYANILLNAGWATVGIVDDNVEIVPAEGKSSEYWHFVKNSDATYTIYNCSNNKVLDVVGAGTDEGTNVWVYENCGNDNQKWYITGPWSGEYVLHPKNSDKVLDVTNFDNAVGTNLQIWSSNGSDAQKFAIYKNPKAEAATLSVIGKEGKADFSWTAGENADRYNLRIKNTKTGETFDVWNIKSLTQTVSLPAGSYTAYVDAGNVYSYAKSNDVTFSVQAHTHSYTASVTQDPTCSVPGEKTFTCSCGDSYTETIPVNASNHVNTTNVAATASTCTVKGYTAGVYCNDCKQYISGHEEQPLANHTITIINKQDATYDAAGYTGDEYCTVCKQTIKTGTAIPKLEKPDEPTQPGWQDQPQQDGGCPWCGGTHNGFIGGIVGFFHRILAAIFGARY